MERILKPDVRYCKETVFNDVPFFSSNYCFVHHLMKDYGRDMRDVLDIACGPGNVPVLLAKQCPHLRITALDGSEELIEMARDSAKGLNIEFVRGRIPGTDLGKFDTILSKDFYHCLDDPSVFWDEVCRFSRPGAAIFVYDFIRPESEAEASDLVEKVMLYENDLLKQDFYTSLCAGFTLDEVRSQVAALGLDVVKTSRAHFLVRGKMGDAGRYSN